MAVWRVPTEHLPDFEEAWERLGWHEYFEQVNLRGPVLAPDALIAQHLAL
jgi:hypothetical protein